MQEQESQKQIALDRVRQLARGDTTAPSATSSAATARANLYWRFQQQAESDATSKKKRAPVKRQPRACARTLTQLVLARDGPSRPTTARQALHTRYAVTLIILSTVRRQGACSRRYPRYAPASAVDG